ncbi:RagB/SusD family nutrient uptake outer membrane protein [Chitinophaga sp. XS-30]|uniref:RagB/SusD family nutrient uptake outer membrane protein n=1 Tax=Chitinophaga sp. XS-30 TaxID=2604421 RepID=UPI00143D2C8B|nr:RagB/SusD family nutrient uptake outer membrane protein [Chitinophaga sp. XS-30]
MRNLFRYISFMLLAAALASCNKYLDVAPKSTLSEEELFLSEVGFQQALTGVYSQLASRALYGDNLTMGFMSALAQNYSVSGAGAPFLETRALNYASGEVIGYTNAIWSAAYSAIAGANKVILNTESKRNVLSDAGYATIRAEALGLRALLHFDMLRIFGQEYTAGAGKKAVPYKKTVDQNPVVPSVTEEVVSLALQDLAEAQDLLKDYDPILTGAVNRRIKMNYYALKALEARIRLYAGDMQSAFNAAEEVVSPAVFPLITFSRASAAPAFRDRLYLTEQVFCIRVRDMLNWVNNEYFRFYGNANMRLTRSNSNFQTLYETSTGGGTDFRYLYRIEQDGGSPFPSKYWQTYTASNTLDSNRLDQYVPAIRLSEMYYIMAESAATPAEGAAYLNVVRKGRGIAELAPGSITAAALQNEITKEYQKEFYAEGQLFFYYKRRKIARMQFMNTNVALSKYVLPIPDSELEFNPNYN